MKSVCAFAGSSGGSHGDYSTMARSLGRAIVERGWALVYGGARVGLMGALADEVLLHGGHVTGIIPESLLAKEVAHAGLSELRVVKSMHERKAMMADLSDGFVALPGGWGTVEELFEVLTWGQLGLHTKPCGLLNVRGYFDHLLTFVGHAVAEGFVRPEYRPMILTSTDPDRLLDLLVAYKPPTVEKWISRSET